MARDGCSTIFAYSHYGLGSKAVGESKLFLAKIGKHASFSVIARGFSPSVSRCQRNAGKLWPPKPRPKNAPPGQLEWVGGRPLYLASSRAWFWLPICCPVRYSPKLPYHTRILHLSIAVSWTMPVIVSTLTWLAASPICSSKRKKAANRNWLTAFILQHSDARDRTGDLRAMNPPL